MSGTATRLHTGAPENDGALTHISNALESRRTQSYTDRPIRSWTDTQPRTEPYPRIFDFIFLPQTLRTLVVAWLLYPPA